MKPDFIKELIEKRLEQLRKYREEMSEHDEMDRRMHKADPDSISKLEKVKMNEGTTAHYQAGMLDGSIRELKWILNNL